MWDGDDGNNVSSDSDNDDSGRLYDFVVAKTNDQEENVVARPGFKVILQNDPPWNWPDLFSRLKMNSPLLVHPQPSPRVHTDLSPRLLHGETTQGFMTAEFKQAKTLVEKFVHSDLSASQVRLLL